MGGSPASRLVGNVSKHPAVVQPVSDPTFLALELKRETDGFFLKLRNISGAISYPHACVIVLY